MPKRDELLNMFAKFIEPKFIPLLLLPAPMPLPLLLPVMFDCAIAGLLSEDDDVKKITSNMPKLLVSICVVYILAPLDRAKLNYLLNIILSEVSCIWITAAVRGDD